MPSTPPQAPPAPSHSVTGGIEFNRLTFTYPGAASPALENVSLRVNPGERLGVLGPNGGGKSTLLKLMLGLLPVQQGSVSVFGLSPALARRRGLIGYVPQRLDAELAFPLSARQVVALGAAWRLAPWKPIPRATRAHIQQMLELVGAAEFADRPIGKLSGGQVQRTLIARALAANPKVLALDEPTVGIDAVGQQRFAELLRTLHEQLRLTIVIVSHDLRAIAAGCDRVACLARRLHSHVSPMSTATGQVIASSLILLPLVMVVDQPWTLPAPGWWTIGAVIGVAAISTAFAYTLYFRILSTAGATNLLLVTLLVPISAILLGTLFLGEALLARHIWGMALIAAGLCAVDGRPVTHLRRVFTRRRRSV